VAVDFLTGLLLSFRHYYLKGELAAHPPANPFDLEFASGNAKLVSDRLANNTAQHLFHKAYFHST
jgi:hypothetical protein